MLYTLFENHSMAELGVKINPIIATPKDYF